MYIVTYQAGKLTPITRMAVRETGVSRHNGVLIKGPSCLKSLNVIVCNGQRGFRGAVRMPRDASLLDIYSLNVFFFSQ